MSAEPSADPVGYGRSEVDLAADVCVQLLEAGVVRRDALGVASLARALDISASEIKQAWVRHGRQGWRRPRRIATTTAAVPSRAALTPRRQWRDEPAEQTCKVCDVEQPIDQFALASAGRRKKICLTCEASKARKRYLSVEMQTELGNILRFVAGRDDACLGEPCPHCDGVIEPGQHVVSRTQGFEHAHCLTEAGHLASRPGDVGYRYFDGRAS